MHGSLTITLTTAPPSLNNCYRNVTGLGRVKTTAYKAWITQAMWEILGQQRWYVAGRVAVWIDVQDGASRADSDNLAKPIVDLLVNAGLIAGDGYKNVKRVSCGYETGIEGVRVTIMRAE